MGVEANKVTNKLIEYCNARGHKVYRISNYTYRKRLNTRDKGISDLLGLTRNGVCLAIETKVEDEQSDDQKRFEQEIISRGGIYIIAHSVDDLINNGI